MSSVIKVAFIESDQYFKKGMLAALTAYFYIHGLKVYLVDNDRAHQADLIFHYFQAGQASCFCRYDSLYLKHRPFYFSLREECVRGRFDAGRCPLEAGVIYHGMAVQSALGSVVSALMQRGAEDEGRIRCTVQLDGLTPRQREVAKCIQKGMALAAVARTLGISTKTVSSHKTAIMRKMGLTRNSELYSWLRHGVISAVLKGYYISRD
ncbi:hypothetical protein BHU62_01880 [Serratia marcescens]|uniref:HTH luxR-type domain-containing protein n=1 Tax=Serratia marcescens TaxID=615 RepID=A0A1Q4P6Q4_SERMA|nr:helix-turn-helix transcriptional regulator [Serratia marcescens]OKB68821.1 hypothetical protein BHU62_01880 [Serratia marcescens]